jgi:hypothetical protein
VTGASLQDQVNPSADFRVIAAEALNVENNQYLDESEANYTSVDPGSFDHNDTSATSGTNLSVNDGADNSLSLALATGNDPDQPTNNFTGGEASYVNDSVDGGTDDSITLNSTDSTGALPVDSNSEAPLQISNETGSDRDVAVQYDSNGASLGADAGSSQPVTQAEVETLFQFFVWDDTDNSLRQISPDGTGSDNPHAYVEVGAGETKQVHLALNLTQSISDSIEEAADASGGGFGTDAEDDVDLLDTAAFGTDT